MKDDFWTGPFGQALGLIQQKAADPIWEAVGKIFPDSPYYNEMNYLAGKPYPPTYDPITTLAFGLMGNMQAVKPASVLAQAMKKGGISGGPTYNPKWENVKNETFGQLGLFSKPLKINGENIPIEYPIYNAVEATLPEKPTSSGFHTGFGDWRIIYDKAPSQALKKAAEESGLKISQRVETNNKTYYDVSLPKMGLKEGEIAGRVFDKFADLYKKYSPQPEETKINKSLVRAVDQKGIPVIIGEAPINPENKLGLKVGDKITKIGIPGKNGKETTSHNVDEFTVPLTYEGTVENIGLDGKQMSFRYEQDGEVYHLLYSIMGKFNGEERLIAADPNKMTSRQYTAVFRKFNEPVLK